MSTEMSCKNYDSGSESEDEFDATVGTGEQDSGQEEGGSKAVSVK